MARLSDYGICLEDTGHSITIRGQEFPIEFTMETMEYIADVYDEDYSIFERDMNDMIERADGQMTSKTLNKADIKIMRALIYGMLRTGGLEESPEVISRLVGMSSEVLTAWATCVEIYAGQTFQVEDLKKSGKPQDFQTPKRKIKNKKRKKR